MSASNSYGEAWSTNFSSSIGAPKLIQNQTRRKCFSFPPWIICGITYGVIHFSISSVDAKSLKLHRFLRNCTIGWWKIYAWLILFNVKIKCKHLFLSSTSPIETKKYLKGLTKFIESTYLLTWTKSKTTGDYYFFNNKRQKVFSTKLENLTNIENPRF